MKCAVFTAPYQFEIQEREKPVPKAGEVVVHVKAAGICGSDIHPYMGDGIERRQPGIIMGHEASGEVDSVGEGVTQWKPGDRVIINPQTCCHECEMCRTGNYHLCDNMLLIGSSMRTFKDGAMCEYIAMPADQLFKLPDNVTFDQGSLLDPLGNAVHLVNRANVKLGDTVVVIGAGTIGLLTMQTARLAGATKVIAIDLDDKKLAIAKQLGVDYTVNSKSENAEEKVKEYTNGRGADVVIEAVGIGVTYNLAMSIVKKKGTVIALGFAQAEINFKLKPFVYNEIDFLGTTGYASECQTTIDYLASGRINTDLIITHTFPLEQVNDGFQVLVNRDITAIKVIIHP